ncbi:UDP-N-acetylmuramate dehydrogenase [Kaistia nematophila]|uniref:UDP-N-acetylenolpyruvoylglucosamine reductase n=1 Tax=Kaistia nematophila TaxID=2994654 RepID=A0A9X3ILM6_9HYPH|nr:UDP-N-acetylmuramate dehydrogenase [Kaistia nematophila]MCX5570829.1 UDP-N-acetylmuramate dehydrogenase [Kaistia nematophila]
MHEILTDYPLDACNSFGFHARSRYAVEIRSEADLVSALADPRLRNLPRRLLGGGSNIVLSADFDGVTLLMRSAGRRLVEAREDAWIVEAAAGETWHDFVRWTLAQGYPGLENLALIPGTVGAAPVQNIGAYGIELQDRFESLRAFDIETGEFVAFGGDDCAFAYRDSVFKHHPGRYVVTGVRFRLPRPWQPVLTYPDIAAIFANAADASPQAVFDEVVAVRGRKLPDPAVIGNAGSFFQNPIVAAAKHEALKADYPKLGGYPQPDGQVKLSAAWLVEQSGFKGIRLGHVGVYERHALILVNHGGGSAAEITTLATRIKDGVLEKFGVQLVEEPVFL